MRRCGNGDGRLKPGMFARVQLEDAARGADGPSAGRCRRRTSANDASCSFPRPTAGTWPRDVETGAERAGRVEIRRGVAAGDRVVVRGAFLLKSQLLASPEGES